MNIPTEVFLIPEDLQKIKQGWVKWNCLSNVEMAHPVTSFRFFFGGGGGGGKNASFSVPEKSQLVLIYSLFFK